MPCSVKRIGRRTSDRLSPRRLCISAKNVTFVLHFPCVARKTKTAPPWEPSHFFWQMRATTGRHYKVNISNFRTENAGDGWAPLQYKNVFQILLDSKPKDKKGSATDGRPRLFSLFACFPFRLLPFFLSRQPKKHERGFGKGGRGENPFLQKGSPPAL